MCGGACVSITQQKREGLQTHSTVSTWSEGREKRECERMLLYWVRHRLHTGKVRKMSDKVWTHLNVIGSSKSKLCKAKISYRAGSVNNLHMWNVHLSTQLEEKRQAREHAVNEAESIAAHMQSVQHHPVHHHNHLQPRALWASFCKRLWPQQSKTQLMRNWIKLFSHLQLWMTKDSEVIHMPKRHPRHVWQRMCFTLRGSKKPQLFV